MYIIICEIDHQFRFDAWGKVLRAGSLGWSWKIGWGRRWEGGSGWGTHAHPWLIHVNVWQKPWQYCKVISLQLKLNKFIYKYNFNRVLLSFWIKSDWDFWRSKKISDPPLPNIGQVESKLGNVLYCQELDCHVLFRCEEGWW